MKKQSTDREIYDQAMADSNAARAIAILRWEIRQGDAVGRKAAGEALRNHVTARELAAIKRVIKRVIKS